MTDNEPSSELCAYADIDAMGRPSGRIALKSSPVVEAVVRESWADVLTSYKSHLQFYMVEELKIKVCIFLGIVRVCACKCGRSCSQVNLTLRVMPLVYT